MLSVIIPTLNEEKYLPRLLTCLRNQTYADFEVIVADSNSIDKTIDTARKEDCRVIVGKNITNPAMARNLGASIAIGDVYLFLDADVHFSATFIATMLREAEKKGVMIAIPFAKPVHRNIINTIIATTANVVSLLFQWFHPYGSGFCILVKKEVFQAVGGFDETIVLGEDAHFLRKARKLGKFRVLTQSAIGMSFRRFQKDGYFKMIVKMVHSTFLLIIIPGIKTKDKTISYVFGHYDHK